MKFQITHFVPSTENGQTVMVESRLDVDFRADDTISAARRFKTLAEEDLGQKVTRTCIDDINQSLTVELESGGKYELKGIKKVERPKMTKEEKKAAREEARKNRNAQLISSLKGTVRPVEMKPQIINGTKPAATAAKQNAKK